MSNSMKIAALYSLYLSFPKSNILFRDKSFFIPLKRPLDDRALRLWSLSQLRCRSRCFEAADADSIGSITKNGTPLAYRFLSSMRQDLILAFGSVGAPRFARVVHWTTAPCGSPLRFLRFAPVVATPRSTGPRATVGAKAEVHWTSCACVPKRRYSMGPQYNLVK